MLHQRSQPPVSFVNLNFTAEDLNSHFLSVTDKTVEGLPQVSFSLISLCPVVSSLFCLSEVSETTVTSIISSLDIKRASGVDGNL